MYSRPQLFIGNAYPDGGLLRAFSGMSQSMNWLHLGESKRGDGAVIARLKARHKQALDFQGQAK